MLESLVQNSRVFVKFVRSKDNGKADALSRMQIQRFHQLAINDNMNEKPSKIPECLWPLNKVWID